MNYLAHAFLSSGKEHLIIGNFIADHVRGNRLGDYSADIIEGIRLHRNIDSFTDAHPDFRSAKRFFYDGFERHSGILVDIYFDHFLAAAFDSYSAVPLSEFSRHIYEVYRKNSQILPAGSARFLDYLTSNNIYLSYASETGIERVLYHLSHRIDHRVRLDKSIALMRSHRPELSDHFRKFFDDVLREFGSDS